MKFSGSLVWKFIKIYTCHFIFILNTLISCSSFFKRYDWKLHQSLLANVQSKYILIIFLLKRSFRLMQLLRIFIGCDNTKINLVFILFINLRETLICCSTYLCIHWFIGCFLCVSWLTRDRTRNPGMLGWCSHQLSYLAGAKTNF